MLSLYFDFVLIVVFCVYSEIDGLRMHIGYGGSMSYKGGKFSYSGEFYVRDLSIDPNLLAWSILEDFIADRGIKSKVEQVWYKIVNEDISTARSICKDKDVEIRKLCEETKILSEVNFYIVYEEKNEDEEKSDDENREEASDEEETNENEIRKEQEKVASGHRSEDEEQILGQRAEDVRFQPLFSQAEETHATHLNHVHAEESETHSEDESPLQGDEYPDSPVETDEEWVNFYREDKKTTRKKKANSKRSRADYDNPPYLWLMKTFNNGDELKDQLLSYVLKTQYDVKLNRWESTKQAAVCTHEN